LQARGISHVVECGPGKVLSRMVPRIVPDLTATALFDPPSLSETKGLLS
jgi:[acyl-carrier-protein] S-malonyltransferase